MHFVTGINNIKHVIIVGSSTQKVPSAIAAVPITRRSRFIRTSVDLSNFVSNKFV